MKLINLFLLLFVCIYASNELTLPACIKSESMNKVIENDWSYASKRIKKFIDNNATSYVNTFMQLVNQPLVLKTDDEYIQEQLEKHQEYLQDENLRDVLPNASVGMNEYSFRIKKEVQYKIYYNERYKNTINATTYRMMYVYIRYLESIGKFTQAYDIYKKIAQRFYNSYQVEPKNFLNLIVRGYIIDEYIKALHISMKSNHYSKSNRYILYQILSQFLEDKKFFSNMLTSEKQQVFKYLDMFYLDVNSSAKTMMKMNFFKGMLKIVEEENLKKNLNNRQTMLKVVKNYKSDLEQIYHELLSFKTMDEYKAYVDKKESITEVFDYLYLPRVFVLYLTDDFEYKSLSHALKYNFTSSEFITFVRKFYIFYDKPWVLGKYKFEYEERLEKNKKFLDSLKN